MPANTSPEYKKAEAEFRKARTPETRLAGLRDMLRTIPKHKGTEHIQADIKSRMKELTAELAGPKKGGAQTGPAITVRSEGAAQISLVGPPNSGKSSLMAKLTGSQTEVGPYPYTTKFPIPGMLAFEDTQFQLVDLPPISPQFMEAWYTNSLQPADASLLVVDVSDPECVDQTGFILNQLAQKRVTLQPDWPQLKRTPEKEDDDEPDPFRLFLPTLLVANKSDLDPNPEEVETLQELLNTNFSTLAISTETGQGLLEIAPFLFNSLGVVRVYTKAPGRKVDTKERPYTIRQGQTVSDVARLVHKEIAEKLRFAKIWGSGKFDGQQVGPEHILSDKDIVELHM